MLKSSDIVADINCPFMGTAVMFDAAIDDNVWIVNSISLSKNGFRIYDSDKGKPSIVKGFSGDYQILDNYILLKGKSSLQIVFSFNNLFTLETLIECKNSKAKEEDLFPHSDTNLYVS